LKTDLHPNYKATTIKCVCGNEVETASTSEGITVDICAKCHPFFTGNQKFVDTRGRIDKFKKRMDAAAPAPEPVAKKEKAPEKPKKEEAPVVEEPKESAPEEVAPEEAVTEEVAPVEEAAPEETPADETAEN